MFQPVTLAIVTAAVVASPLLREVERMNGKLISVDEESAHIVACHFRSVQWRVLLDQRVRSQLVSEGYLDKSRQLSVPESLAAEQDGLLNQRFHREGRVDCARLAKMPFLQFYDQLERGEVSIDLMP